MKYVKTTLLVVASAVALSQPALADDSAQLTLDASLALNSILADNIADIKNNKVTKVAEQSIAKLETQLQNNLIAQESLIPSLIMPEYKVIIAD